MEESQETTASADALAQDGSSPEAEAASRGPPAAPAPPVPKEQAPPPPPPVKVDGQADAFAKFFKRVGKETMALDPEKAVAAMTPPAPAQVTIPGEGVLAQPPASPPPAPPVEEPAKEASSAKEKEKEEEPEKELVWPRRAPERDAKKPAPEKAEEDPKTSPKLGFGLPPPGTVTKTTKTEEVIEPPAAEDDGERVQEVSPLDHRFVGLVIGKAGETIKSFKKQSGASIEIDQNLPDGMPRVVIYRGTRKQVAAAKKLVDGLVQRAKEDEKSKNNGAPIGAGMGILGRGPAGEGKEKEPAAPAERGRPDEAVRSDLPPWRRTKPGEEEPRPPAAEPRGPRNSGVARRDAPWAKREKECEAAPSGSLTGSLSTDAKLGMRPSWMKPSKGSGDADEGGMLGPFDRSLWHEQKYTRGLFLQAKQKILRSKAYEVPEEMMTMTTGLRPKWKPERREKEGAPDEPAPKEAPVMEGPPDVPPPPPPTQLPDPASSEEAVTKKNSGNGNSAGTPVAAGPYENLPGDSKDIMKLKKKLREIQKIEDSMNKGENVEPNQREKITKKAGYLEELQLLESIVHAPASGNSA